MQKKHRRQRHLNEKIRRGVNRIRRPSHNPPSPLLVFVLQGRGIVHAEMPFGQDRGWGLQLWVNLKSKDKMVEPAYQVIIAKGGSSCDGFGVS